MCSWLWSVLRKKKQVGHRNNFDNYYLHEMGSVTRWRLGMRSENMIQNFTKKIIILKSEKVSAIYRISLEG
jgi:hypothetical protein